MPEDPGGYLSGQKPVNFRALNLSAVSAPVHPPAVVQPAAPAVPTNDTPPTPTTPGTDWTKIGIFAAIGAALVFVVAGRKKKRR